ncbi:hypothetical protein [Deinococcus multiflagellatus]|uniref:Uncharacterized protein n=1 Tax=Deinococcus multiflagellatus TaxID=1656887 RepID=A0ABW1ZT51_9DEIO
MMLIGLSDTQVELVAAPGTAGALRDALLTQPLPIVERLMNLLNSAA